MYENPNEVCLVLLFDIEANPTKNYIRKDKK